MPRLALIGGAYSARWVGANCQRAINYYPEPNSKDASVPVTHYQRPGLLPRVTREGEGTWRCLYRASNGIGYGVCADSVYVIDGNWGLHFLGNVIGGRTNLCSMIDNGIEILVVDGSPFGWIIDLVTNAFRQVSDPTGAFTGADRVDILDTFIVWNKPDTQQWGSTLSGQIEPFDPLFFASKSRYPDTLLTIFVNHYEIILLGTLKGEIWFDAGAPQFPFASLPGSNIEHGVGAIYSVAQSDISVFWLGQDLQGQAFVFRLRNYETRVVSNYAISYAIQSMLDNGISIDDAIGYCYAGNGHLFYVLTFPSGDQTWVFDDSIGDPDLAWHQRAWTDQNGALHRERANCFAFLNGKLAVGDWENGTLYTMENRTYTDTLTVGATPGPISFIRTFPHLLVATGADGQPRLADGKMMEYNSFVLDVQVGFARASQAGALPEITLNYSDDRGVTYTGHILQSNGNVGEYQTQPKWSGIGQARDRVFEIAHSIDGEVALNGAWVEAKVLNI